MKKHTQKALIATGLAMSFVASASAANALDAAATGIFKGTLSIVEKTLDAKDIPNASVPSTNAPSSNASRQDIDTIGFSALEKEVRAGNESILGFEKTLKGILNTDISESFDSQRDQYAAQKQTANAQIQMYTQQIASLNAALAAASDASVIAGLNAQLQVAQASLQTATINAAVADGAMDAIDDAEEDAEDNLQDTYNTTKKQLENAGNQIVMGAQSAYMGIVQIESSLGTIDRNLAALDRQIAVVQTQVKIGMASQLTLDNLKQSRASLAVQRDSIAQQQAATENQLSRLIGNSADKTVKIAGMPEVSSGSMNYESDLAEALKNSYTIWSKKDDLRIANNNYADNASASKESVQAAKIAVTAAEEDTKTSFRKIYLNVQDKLTALTSANAAYALEQRNFAVDEVRYSKGMISKLDYETAKDELKTAEEAVATAKIDLINAQNTYDWAKRGVITG